MEQSSNGKGYQYLGGVREKIVREHSLRHGNILEIGAGDGYYTAALGKNLIDGKVIALENIKEFCKDAEENVKNAGVKEICKIENIDFWKNEYHEEAFDMVTTFLSVCNIAVSPNRLDNAFKEMHRLLKPGGKLLLAEKTPEDCENEAQRIDFEIDAEFGYSFYSKEQILKELKNAKFQSVKVHSYKAGEEKLGLESLQNFLEEHAYCAKKCGISHLPIATIHEKYKDAVEKYGIEPDSKITLFSAEK